MKPESVCALGIREMKALPQNNSSIISLCRGNPFFVGATLSLSRPTRQRGGSGFRSWLKCQGLVLSPRLYFAKPGCATWRCTVQHLRLQVRVCITRRHFLRDHDPSLHQHLVTNGITITTRSRHFSLAVIKRALQHHTSQVTRNGC